MCGIILPPNFITIFTGKCFAGHKNTLISIVQVQDTLCHDAYSGYDIGIFQAFDEIS